MNQEAVSLDVKGLHVAAVHVASLLGCEDCVLAKIQICFPGGGFNRFQRFLDFYPHLEK